MSFDDQDILDEFIVESTEHLADIEGQLLTIEAAGADCDTELVNTVFRGVHSIKGAAGFLGLTTINLLAHSMENVLNMMRERQLMLTSAIVDVMLESADTLSELLHNVSESNEADVSQHIAALEAIGPDKSSDGEPASKSVSTKTPPAAEPSPKNCEPSLNEPVSPAAKVETPAPKQPPAPVAAKPNKTNKKKAPAKDQTKISAESNIRVPVETLDQLMNLAGELVLSRNQLMQTIGSSDQGGLEAVAARINQVTSELQDAIMQTRMQPIGNVFTRFTRVVRDLSTKLGKKCRLEIEGQEVEVDKTIIEAIGDPLTHLVRNAVDHGMEKPAQRVSDGKPEMGLIQLRARHQSGKVRIEIKDDGAGIDTVKMKRKAVEKGLISAEAASKLDDAEAARLIFHPGFSTAEKVSDVSGRGVGMDVVRTNIERLGGVVEIETKVGTGTTILITLPLTLAIVPSLIIQSDDDRYAIPQVNIVELVRVQPHELSKRIDRLENSEVIKLRGNLLPLVRLREASGLDESTINEDEQVVNIVVVETGQQRYGLVVDELHNSEEIVVKPLGRHLKDCPCLSGATILGDGHVALILDVAGIAAHTGMRSVSQRQPEEQPTTVQNTLDSLTLLLFTNHPNEQFAIPTDLIARIDRIRSDQIDSISGLQLLQFRGQTLRLLRLEGFTSAKPRDEVKSLHVIVFTVAGQEVGLIAPRLQDIHEVPAKIDSSSLREPGFSGSMIINEKPTRLVDVYELTKLAHPEWFSDPPVQPYSSEPNDDEASQQPVQPNHAEPSGGGTVLFAEDSEFFRNQVKRFMQEDGFRVVEAVDGQAAWKMLQAGEQVDAVVTDVQMPHMTGFELCSKIKNDPSHSHLPVITLTSLATEDDMSKGREAGVDNYLVKLDREKLMNALSEVLNRPSSVGSIPNRESAENAV